MKVIAVPKSTMLHQCLEGHEISKLSEGTCINRRGEWGKNLPPKLTVDDPDEKYNLRRIPLEGAREGTMPQNPH